jgi:hypothetical protein
MGLSKICRFRIAAVARFMGLIRNSVCGPWISRGEPASRAMIRAHGSAGRGSIVSIVNNNRKSNDGSAGPSKSLARRPRVMTFLHAWLLLMMPPKKMPGAVSRPGAIPQFLFHE